MTTFRFILMSAKDEHFKFTYNVLYKTYLKIMESGGKPITCLIVNM